MTPQQTRHIAIAMSNRSRQWKIRAGLAVAVAVMYFPLTGPVFATAWLIAYGLLQVFELRFVSNPAWADRLGERYPAACVALVFVVNLVFGSLGAAEVFGGNIAGLTCAALLFSGAIVNAALVSPASRSIMLASALPPMAYFLLLPIGAWMLHSDALFSIQLTVAAGLMVAVCLGAWAQLSRYVLAMETAQTQAEAANRAKSDFLATMSHEIRTPLNGVLGMAQAMAADELSPAQKGRLEIITDASQALLVILNDVLDLAKIEARKIELEQAEFDLETLVERCAQTFRAISDKKGLTFETLVAPRARGPYKGDATRLHQILSNLVSNAMKFTEAGKVSLTADYVDGDLLLLVEDTGPGVSESQLPRLFKKFEQADASTTRRYGGTGLGLSICGELADLMGGTIVPSHVRPHGLRFEVRIPVPRPRFADPVADDGAETDQGVEVSAIRVLAAEDHPVNRQVLTLLLSQVGISPHIVENGELAVQAWREGAPDGDWDLILMDVQMPVMDGPTAARMIREEERARGLAPTPIIALTANVMSHQIEDYHRSGMQAVVPKPIQIQELLDGIERVLADRAHAAPAETQAA